jgi:hypothetical protein
VLQETLATQTRKGAERLWKVVDARSNQAITKKDCKNVKATISNGSGIQDNGYSSDALIEAADQAFFREMHLRCNQVVGFHAGQAMGDR